MTASKTNRNSSSTIKMNTQDPQEQAELNERLKGLVRLEILSQKEKEWESNVARIRQTVKTIIDEDLTLQDKMKLIFGLN